MEINEELTIQTIKKQTRYSKSIIEKFQEYWPLRYRLQEKANPVNILTNVMNRDKKAGTIKQG